MNELSSTIHGKKILPNFQPPAEYTGELFGVEYLFAQSGVTFKPAASEDDLINEIDEGFGDIDEQLDDSEASSDDATVALPPDSASEDEVSTYFVHALYLNVYALM